MIEIVTYTLRETHKHSDQYYQDVAAFTDETLYEAQNRVQPLVKAFRTYVKQTDQEPLRTDPEYTLELLTLGVLWRVYANDALSLAQIPRRVLIFLTHLRGKGGRLKPGIDWVRGWLGGLFMSSYSRRPVRTPEPNLKHVDRLLKWLSATDTFGQEIKRLQFWRDFLTNQAPDRAIEFLRSSVAFAAWFEAQSKRALGCYTPHVERFLNEAHPSYRWREDYVFCGRQRVEYHLNMVGTEILNRAFRDDFVKTKRQMVLLPPCMQAQPEGVCQAQLTPLGSRCADCTPGCRIHQLTKLGEKHGFEVLIMPHELSVFSSGAIEPIEGSAVGIVGVSCPLTNPSGGWETKDLGIPAQGLLLDYCGCPWHWHEQGIPTDINLHQLLRMVREDKKPL